MGLFSSGVKVAQEAVAGSSPVASAIAAIVNRRYKKNAEFVPPDGNGDGSRFEGLGYLARDTEKNYHGVASMLLDQLVSDGHTQATRRDVHRAIIEAVRDIKLKQLAPNSQVSTLDLMRIRRDAEGFGATVRSAWLDRQMEGVSKDPAELSAALDDVEDAAAIQATNPIDASDEPRLMRAYQAVTWAVAEVRIQQFAKL